MSDAEQASSRAKILAEFSDRWGPEGAERRVKILEEILPRLYSYAELQNQRVDVNMHPEHLEHYIAYLNPRVRAVLELVAPTVIDKIEDSHSLDERIAKVLKCVNLIDAKAAELKKTQDQEGQE